MSRSSCIIALLLASGYPAQAGQQVVVVRGATLVDVSDGRLVENATITVDGDRIVSVVPGGAVAAGATVLDAAGKYVVPGLIDLHVHYKDWSAELYLNHGVTTVVSLGEYVRVDQSPEGRHRQGGHPGTAHVPQHGEPRPDSR